MKKSVFLCLVFASGLAHAQIFSSLTVTTSATFGTVSATSTASFDGDCIDEYQESYSTLTLPDGTFCSASAQETWCNSSTAFIPSGANYVVATYSGFTGDDSTGAYCEVEGDDEDANVTVPEEPTGLDASSLSSTTLQAGQPLNISAELNASTDINGTITAPNPSGDGSLTVGSLTLGTGPVTVTGDGHYLISIAAPTSGTPPGKYSVLFNYLGDGNYLPSTGSTTTVTVLPAHLATSSALSLSPNPIVAGENITATATITPTGTAAPGGTVTFLLQGKSAGNATVTNGKASVTVPADLAPGTYSVQALYGGDQFNLPSTSAVQTLKVVSSTSTTTALTVTPTTIVDGNSASITVKVTPAIGNASPAGTVSVYLDGSALTTLTLKNGGASLTASTVGVAAGTYALKATYNGSATAIASTSNIVNVTIAAGSTLSLTASPNPVAHGSITTLTAVVKTGAGSPVNSGTIQFSYAGNSLGSASLNSSGTAQLPISTSGLAVGSYKIEGSYGGATGIPAAAGMTTLVVN